MKSLSSAVQGLVLIATQIACAHGAYVLPVADGGAREPSPPSIEGRIAQVDHGNVAIDLQELAGKPAKQVTIRVDQDTEIFTVYGGYVSLSELAPGQRVRVWFQRPPHSGRDGISTAAVVMLASINPDDEWP